MKYFKVMYQTYIGRCFIYLNLLKAFRPFSTNMIRFTVEVSIIKLQTIFFKFLFSLENQSFNICLIILLFLKSQNLFAILLCLAEFLPGVLTVWQKYLSEDGISWINGISGFSRIWNQKIFFLWFHPINVVVWPLVVAFDASDKNIEQLQV